VRGAPSKTTGSELRQVVHSPEQYRLELPLAGPSSRILAYAIDYLLISLLSIVVIALAFLLFPLAAEFGALFEDFREAVDSDDPNALQENNFILVILGFLIVVQLVVEWVYFIFFEMTLNGRSPGKAAVKLRVVGDGGHPLGFGQSVARNLLRTVDILPLYYIVGLVSMVVSEEAKRLGDMAAGTIVIRLDRPAGAAPIESAFEGETDVFRFDHAQLAKVGAEELRLVRQTLRRLPELGQEPAALALERTVTALTDRLDYPPVPAAEREIFLHALLRAAQRR